MTELMAQYAIPTNELQKYPAIQATDYQPKSLKSSVLLGLAADSYDMLTEESQKLISTEIIECNFKNGAVGLYEILSSVQWVILGMPQTFLYEKDTGKYRKIVAGEKLAGTRTVTAARLYLCALAEDNLLLASDGTPQVFGLTLKSSKTGLIKKQSPEPGDGTIFSLNNALAKHYKIKGWLTHLVSVSLKAVPEKFTSSQSGDTSIGVIYKIGNTAKALSPSQQQATFELLQDEELKAAMADPFKLNSRADAPESIDGNGSPSIDDIGELF